MSSSQIAALTPASSVTTDAAWASVIDDRESIVLALTSLLRHQVAGVVIKDHVRFPIRPIAIHGDCMHWRLSTAIVSAPCEIEIAGYNAVFSIPVHRAMQQGHTLITPIPTQIRAARRRWCRRAEPSEEMRAHLHGIGGSVLTAPIDNVSYSGLQVRLDKDVALIPGQRLPHVAVWRLEGEQIALDCEVRFVRHGKASTVVGLRIRSASSADAWKGCVDDCLHPRTRAGGMVPEAQWRLFDRCGYFRLSNKTSEDFARLKRAYCSVSRQLHSHPHLATQVVWGPEKHRDVTAAATALKVYSGTWLGIQMAKDSGDAPDGTPGRQVLRELNYRLYEHVQQDPDLQWFYTCIQDKRVWTRLVFHDYPASLEAQGDAAVVRFRALEVDVDTRWTDLRDSETAIDIASSDELDTLCHHISETRPVAYRESLDLTRDRILMKQNQTMWRRSRLERSRVVLVARKGDVVTAAAVLEVAPDGAHLFGLLDLVRLYTLEEGGEEQFADLLDAAKGWFASFEKDRFVCHLETDKELSDALKTRTTDLGEADMCIIAARRIPELLENMHKVAAPNSATPVLSTENTQVG